MTMYEIINKTKEYTIKTYSIISLAGAGACISEAVYNPIWNNEQKSALLVGATVSTGVGLLGLLYKNNKNNLDKKEVIKC
jgi:hypothetical protein